jgi:hypothetical protein
MASEEYRSSQDVEVLVEVSKALLVPILSVTLYAPTFRDKAVAPDLPI